MPGNLTATGHSAKGRLGRRRAKGSVLLLITKMYDEKK